MATRLCWRCGTRSHMTPLTGPTLVGLNAEGRAIYHMPFKCDECNNVSLAELADREGREIAQQFEHATDVVWFPASAEGKRFPDVPEHIADAASEAHTCMDVAAYRGAIALARAVVESTAKDHDIKSGNLEKKIDELAKKCIISVAMKDAAHEIRFAGNEVAHGDLADEPITADDAQEVVALMDAMLTRVYQEPAQVARVRARREERKQTAQSETFVTTATQ